MKKKQLFLSNYLSILIFLITNAYSANTYYTHNSKDQICEAVQTGKTSFSYRVTPPRIYERIFIPPHLTTLVMRAQMKAGSDNLKIALRYGTKPQYYSPSYDHYTDIIPKDNPIKSIDQMRGENVILLRGSQSVTYSVFNITNYDALQGNPDGDWLYVNVYNGLERVGTNAYGYMVDKDSILKWCTGGIKELNSPKNLIVN